MEFDSKQKREREREREREKERGRERAKERFSRLAHTIIIIIIYMQSIPNYLHC